MYIIYPVVCRYDLKKDDDFLLGNQVKIFDCTSYIYEKLSPYFDFEKVNTKEEANFLFIEDKDLEEEEYKLEINKEKITIYYKKYSGMVYASTTLVQIMTQVKDGKIEGLCIRDCPEVKIRGYMQDISRNKVLTKNSIFKILDLMEMVKMNHFELYVEGFSIELKSFKEYLTNNGYIKIKEYKEIEKYAKKKAIDLVPNCNGFGHMAKFLALDEFKNLAECPGGSFMWGWHRDPNTLDPSNEGSIDLVKKIYKDLLPHSKSKYFHMNFDEPFELGRGNSLELVKEKGLGVVYVDFLLKAYEEVKKYKKIPLIWTDVLNHHPELFDKLPKDMLYIDWGYDAPHRFDKNIEALVKIGGKVLAAPGTASWCSFLGRSQDAILNIDAAVDAILKHKGEGVLLTDWGDFGHLQFPVISLMMIVYTGLKTWRKQEGSYFKLIDFSNKYIWKDKDKNFAQTLLDLGYYYRYLPYNSNCTSLFLTFIHSVNAVGKAGRKDDEIGYFIEKVKYHLMSEKTYSNLNAFFDIKSKEIKYANIGCEDSELLKKELLQSIKELKLIMKLNISFNENVENKVKIKLLDECYKNCKTLVKDHKKLWIKRAKVGGYQNTEDILNSFIKFVGLALEHFKKRG